jgi:hypothetical protein
MLHAFILHVNHEFSGLETFDRDKVVNFSPKPLLSNKDLIRYQGTAKARSEEILNLSDRSLDWSSST